MEELEVTITYETLFDILRREKSRDELQKLSPGFYRDVAHYLDEKLKVSHEQSPLDDNALKILNIKKMIRELHDRREKKILLMAMDRARTGSNLAPTDGMLPEELEMYDEMTTLIQKFRTGILSRLLAAQQPLVPTIQKTTTDKQKNITLLFKEAVPKFLGRNLETYGPFNVDEIANLPEEIGHLLVKQGKAETIHQ